VGRNRESQHVFLVGVKHTGKSHVAKLIAKMTNRRLIDIDEAITDLYAAESGHRLVVRDIYGRDDGQSFRRLEAVACSQAAESAEPVVVATGGGVCDNSNAVAALQDGLIVALEAEPLLLFNRIMERGIPAFMKAGTRAEAWTEFEDLHRRRSALYREMTDVVVEVSDRSPQEVAAEVIIRIEEHIHGGK